MIDPKNADDLDILNRIDKIKNQDELFQSLLSLAPNLSSESVGRAIEVATKINRLSSWHKVLILMAPHFTHDLFQEIINTPKHSGNRGATLINLSPHIPPTLFADALKITREINQSRISAAVLDNLLPRIEDPILILEALSISIHLDSSIRNIIASQIQQKFQQRLDLLSEVEALKFAEDLLSSKNYDGCAQTLVTIIPYLSSKSLLKALEIARSINDNEANQSCVNALTILNHEISERYLKTSNNNSLCEDWRHEESDNWKKWVAINFEENNRWMGRDNSNYDYETNLAIWRAIGNEVIDKRFCQAPRSRAKVLAVLYYYFEGSQQIQIFEELLGTIEEMPTKSCKARSYIALVLHLPYPNAIKIIKRALSVVKEIYEDIINLDLRDSRVEPDQYVDPRDQYREQHIYTEIQNGYTEIQRLERQLHDLTISKLRKEIFWLIETTDYFLFPYPRWWKPNMIEGLPPALIALEKPSESR